MISTGCTCKNIFTVPFEGSEVESIFITYRQNNRNVVEKNIDECEFSEGHVSVMLTQEDTLKFTDNAVVKIQIRARLKNGTVTKSRTIETVTDEVFKNEVI